MKNDLVTIIIPAYNSEGFIQRCLDSVFSQTYKNIEVIVVNDGSTDNTTSIVQIYENVILLSKENGGLCSARNFGVKHAHGKYVIFLDSDDCLEDHYIYNLISHASGKNDELVMCDFLMNGKKENESWDYLVMEGRLTIYSQFLHGGICNRTVNKLYPLDMIKDVEFPEGRDMLEDAYFTSHVLEKCNKLIRIPYAGYYYIRRDDSLSKRKHKNRQISEKYSNQLEKDIYLSKYVPESDYEYLSNMIVLHIKQCINFVRDLYMFDMYSKIVVLVDWLKDNTKNNKSIKKFCNSLSNCSTEKKMRSKFVSYTLFNDNWKNKRIFFKSVIRKIITKD